MFCFDLRKVGLNIRFETGNQSNGPLVAGPAAVGSEISMGALTELSKGLDSAEGCQFP